MTQQTSPEAVVIGADRAADATALALAMSDTGLPQLAWVGTAARAPRATDVAALSANDPVTTWEAWMGGSPVHLLPEHGRGWLGRPGLSGFRMLGSERTSWSPAFSDATISETPDGATVTARDATAGLRIDTELQTTTGGGIRLRHRLTNEGAPGYVVESLSVTIPLADTHTDIVDFSGRWAYERVPQRHRVAMGEWVREHRRGTRSLDATSIVMVGSPGFDFGTGDVLGVHLAWSGNHRYGVEQLSSGQAVVSAGELLLPGEIVLDRGESYETPWVYLVASDAGTDSVAAAFHSYLRSLDAHPTTVPISLNVWEAVYFDHDEAHLIGIAETAATIGVERLVLDDGWFAGRNDDTAGLGDWTPDPEKWPRGLSPLIERTHALGMQFGLWWEPEAINPNSELYRQHPDWVLSTGDRLPRLERHSLVLDLDRLDVREYLLAAFDALMAEHRIDFIKWDHNRDVIDGGSSTRGGSAGVHAQTVAFYALLDTLRERYPNVSWESCASGGGRIDIEVMSRVQSAWVSDVTDPLSRQRVQQTTAQTLPLEYLSAQIADGASHQTGRTTSLDFRAATSFFGQLGLQLDLTHCSPAELAELTEWLALYKRHRRLLHTGRLQRANPHPEIVITVVMASDANEALVSYAQLGEIVTVTPRLRVRGLNPDSVYRVSRVAPTHSADSDFAAPGLPPLQGPAHWPVDGVTVTGRTLADFGIPGPDRAPQSACILHLQALGNEDTD